MKISGIVLNAPKPIPFTVIREDAEGKACDVTFMCGPVLDYKEFELYYPQPVPPLVTDIKSKQTTKDFNDKKYLAKMDEWSESRVNYSFIKSLMSTPNLEWDTVKIDVPDSWKNWRDELRNVMTEQEVVRLMQTIMESNNPTTERRKEALANFTSTQVEQ